MLFMEHFCKQNQYQGSNDTDLRHVRSVYFSLNLQLNIIQVQYQHLCQQ